MPSKIVSGKTTFRATYADSNALWRVIRSQGKGTYLCEIVAEPIEIDGHVYSGDYVGVQKAFLRTEVLHSLNMQQFWNDIHDDCDKFYDSLRPGQIVHYHNGFGCYVRCEVVLEDQIKLKQIALVGDWQDYDLPKRLPDGEILYSYHAEKVMNQELFRPNATNLWEFKPEGEDPSKFPVIDLSVPDMTPEQKELADLWSCVNAIRKFLDEHPNDPRSILESIRLYVQGINTN